MHVKARAGRGRKRVKWVSIVYGNLVSKFERLRGSGVCFDAPLIGQLSIDIIAESRYLDCNKGTMDERSGLMIKNHINPNWITRFMY